MARSKDPNDPYHHKHRCSGRHSKGHWCWTNAEIKTLRYQAGVLHLDWRIIAKSFTIDGFVRHTTAECFKKWSKEFRDPYDRTPVNATTLQENTQP